MKFHLLSTLQKYENDKHIYLFATIADRGLSFLLPIIVLYLFGLEKVYNEIEYVYSISNLMLAFLDFGIIKYLFYGHKISSEPNYFLKKIKGVLVCLLSVVMIITLMILIYFDNHIIILFILSRSSYLLCYQYYNNLKRLQDQPLYGVFPPIIVNLLDMIIISILYYLFGFQNIIIYVYFGVTFLYPIYIIWDGFREIDFTYFIDIGKKSFIYTWPLMLNTLLVMLLNNYGKVFAYNQLSQSAMTNISYLLRICMVIQLFHGAISSFQTKAIYDVDDGRFLKKEFYEYLSYLCLALFLFYVIIFISNKFGIVQTGMFSVLFLSMYMIFWCIGAYLEQYLNKTNNNKFILFANFVGVILFFGFMFGISIESINEIILFMFLSSLIQVTIISLFLNKSLSNN